MKTSHANLKNNRFLISVFQNHEACKFAGNRKAYETKSSHRISFAILQTRYNVSNVTGSYNAFLYLNFRLNVFDV